MGNLPYLRRNINRIKLIDSPSPTILNIFETLTFIKLNRLHYYFNKMTENGNLNAKIVRELTGRVVEVEKKISCLTHELKDIKSILVNFQGGSNTSTSRSYSTKRLGDDDDNYGNQPKRANIDSASGDFVKDGDYVVVYTDGACENNGKPNAKAGVGVWFGQNHPLNLSLPVIGRATNNTAEIQACVHALKICHQAGVKKLKIKTDSQFVISSITQWIHNWKKNNWKVKSGGDVKNKEDFINLDKACQFLDSVKWEHVDGHRGIVGNEEADKLARNGAVLYSKRL